jgi:superfamily II DNA/RNA helicase
MKFNELKLSKALLTAITKSAYKEATSIQEKVIPLVLEKKRLNCKSTNR